MPKRLYRSRRDRVISGVAGGLGQYFGIDAVIIRLVWAGVVLVMPPSGFILYILAAIIIPRESVARVEESEHDDGEDRTSGVSTGAMLLVGAGLFILLHNLGLGMSLSFLRFGFPSGFVRFSLPLAIILVGLVLFLRDR